MKEGAAFTRHEVDSIYVDSVERFVVSLIVGYPSAQVRTAKRAAAAALALTRDDGSPGTVWKVYDRTTGTMHEFTQGEFERER